MRQAPEWQSGQAEVAALEDQEVHCAVSCAGRGSIGLERITDVDKYGNKVVICCLFTTRPEQSVTEAVLGFQHCEGTYNKLLSFFL